MSDKYMPKLSLKEVLIDIAYSPVGLFGGPTVAQMNSSSVSNMAKFNAKAREIYSEERSEKASVPAASKPYTVTKSGMKLVNHYIGGYHYFTVAN
jgi:hypothetical protein